MLVTCPSGLSFNARNWRIGDRRNLHDNRIIKQGRLLVKMLETVDEGVVNPGPYDFKEGKKVPWSRAALNDIIDALVAIRVSTRPILAFNEICSECRAQIPLEVDLRGLDREEMPVEGKQHLATGEPISCTLPTKIDQDTDEVLEEVDIKVRLLRGQDMQTIMKYQRQDPADGMEAQLVLHITEISAPNGEPITAEKNLEKIWDFYREQSWEFHSALDDFIGKMSGGVETRVSADCNKCGADQETIIPFAGEFFYPRKVNRSSSTVRF